MTTSFVSLQSGAPIPDAIKKKRVLLIDGSTTKRDVRAETMRKIGIEVDCAADISEARAWWRSDLYDLVLIDLDNGSGHRDKFCNDLREAKPPQQVAFLVGKPDYLAVSPAVETMPLAHDGTDPEQWGDVKTALAADLSASLSQRWGIMEASRRISAVRSLSHARSKAMRDRPAPPRDLEKREARRADTHSRTLDDLLREDMQ